MRASQSACLIWKYAGRLRLNLVAGSRAASSRTRPNDTFDASKLVLDLDAADSKYVRQYDESRDRDSFSYSPDPADTESSVNEEVEKWRRHDERLAYRFPGPDYLYSATGADYLALSLFSDFSDLRSCSRSLMAVLSRNKVPNSWYDESFERQVAPTVDLLNHAPLNSIETSQEPPFEAILETIRRCDKFVVLQRATGLLTRTVEGCRFLASNGAVILDGIRQCRIKIIGQEPFMTTGVVLEYITNLTTNMESKGVEVGPIICDLGLYYASKVSMFSVIKRYIDMAISRQYHPAERHPRQLRCHREKALHVFAFRPPWLDALDLYRTHEIQMEAALKLLTGWNVGGVPSDGEKRQPSFANFTLDGAHMYREYMLTLGRLGASEALLCEWSNPDLTPAPPTITETDRITIFMDAMTAVRARSIGTTRLRGKEVNQADRSPEDDLHLIELEDSIYRQLPGKLRVEMQPLQDAVENICQAGP